MNKVYFSFPCCAGRRPSRRLLLIGLALPLSNVASAPGEAPAAAVRTAEVVAYQAKGAALADLDPGSSTPVEGRLGTGLQFDGEDDTASLKAPVLSGPS